VFDVESSLAVKGNRGTWKSTHMLRVLMTANRVFDRWQTAMVDKSVTCMVQTSSARYQ